MFPGELLLIFISEIDIQENINPSNFSVISTKNSMEDDSYFQTHHIDRW